MSPAIHAVIFDWGGTLTPWHDVNLVEQWRAYARALDVDEAEACALADRVLAAEAAAWGRSRGEQASTSMDAILAAAGIDTDTPAHEDALTAYRAFWEPHTITDPQVRPLWEGLHGMGIRVGVLSNTIWSGDYHRALFERDGVRDLIDGDVYSSEIPWTKPHPQAFRAAAAAVGVDPERCVYVGDRIFEDVHGPQQAGMRGIHIPHSRIPTDQHVLVEAEPDGVAHELLDVLDIVGQWT